MNRVGVQFTPLGAWARVFVLGRTLVAAALVAFEDDGAAASLLDMLGVGELLVATGDDCACAI